MNGIMVKVGASARGTTLAPAGPVVSGCHVGVLGVGFCLMLEGTQENE